jgi:ATP-dependent Clp protease ATP-binding subunit ClpC
MPGAELLYLLRSLNDDARNVLAIGLGEALRLGTPWLGVEYLIMGLVRYPEELLAGFFRHIKMDPSVIRAALRGMIPIQNKNWRRVQNVERLGNKTLSELQEIDREPLLALWGSDAMPRAVLTPRLRLVLRKAVSLAKGGKVGPDHLLLALVEQRRSPSVELLLGMVEPNAEQPPAKLIEWIESWRRDPEALKALLRPAAPLAYRVEHATDPAPPMPGAEDVLASYLPPSPTLEMAGPSGPDIRQLGRDLTRQAREGLLRPAVGKSASETMVQLGSILLQSGAGNPLLIGDPGVGKTAVVEGLAWRLAVGHHFGQPVAPQLANWHILELRPDALAQVAREAIDLDTWVQDVADELGSGEGRSILFLDDVQASLEAKDVERSRVLALLELLLAKEELPCLCATTLTGFRRHFDASGSLSQHLTPIWVREPSLQEAIAIARAVAQERLAPRHNVYYPPDAVEEAVRLAVRYLHDDLLPGKAVRLLDQAGTSVLLSGTLGGTGSSDMVAQVTVETMREIVANQTGILLTRLRENEGQRLIRVEQSLNRSVTGQDEAVEQVLRVVKRGRVGLSDPHRPQGVFLFAGPSGVGQIELAMSLAEALFDERDAYLHVSMTEYHDLSQVSGLLGGQPRDDGPPEEGRLTAWLRRHPYSVVLLDEIEAAHPEVQHLLLRLFDSGNLADARGSVDARNSIFVLTTGIGSVCQPDEPARFSGERAQILIAIEARLAPELLDRIDRVICFTEGNERSLRDVLEAKLSELSRRVQRAQGVTLRATEGFKQGLLDRFADSPRGASRVRRALERVIEDRLTDALLAGRIGRGDEVVLDVGDVPSLAGHGDGGRP